VIGNSKGQARLIPRLIVWPAALLQQSTVREGDRHYEENQRLYRCASAMKKLREALSSTWRSPAGRRLSGVPRSVDRRGWRAGATVDVVADSAFGFASNAEFALALLLTWIAGSANPFAIADSASPGEFGVQSRQEANELIASSPSARRVTRECPQVSPNQPP